MSETNDGPEGNAIGSSESAVSRWRVATAIAGTLAVALFAVAVGDRMVPAVNPHAFVAVLTSSNAPPAFVATVNLDSPTLVVRRLADPPPPDRNYVLWAAAANAPPRALGVLDQPRNTYRYDLTGEVTLEVTVEARGAPIPQAPTAPAVFSGKLVAGN